MKLPSDICKLILIYKRDIEHCALLTLHIRHHIRMLEDLGRSLEAEFLKIQPLPPNCTVHWDLWQIFHSLRMHEKKLEMHGAFDRDLDSLVELFNILQDVERLYQMITHEHLLDNILSEFFPIPTTLL